MTDLESYAKHARVWGYYSGDRSEEVDFWETLARRYGTSVMALMSATGEMAATLARRGFRVCAVDFIPEMIQEGQRRYSDIPTLTFEQGDVRSLWLDKNDYDFAFTSDFNHLLTQADCLAALASIQRTLRPGAGLGLELSFPATESWNQPWQTFEPMTSQLDLDIQDHTILKTWKKGKASYDADSRMTTIEQEVYIQQGKEVEQFSHNFQLKLWNRQEIYTMLRKAGFSLVKEYGSYRFDPWTSGSQHWLIEAVKNSS
jgi:ubiquinone/menaquinone biosynthesis C-methylase UbiE